VRPERLASAFYAGTTSESWKGVNEDQMPLCARAALVLGLGMANLAEKECVPCKGGVPPLRGVELARLLRELGEGWRVVDEHHLDRDFKFDNFRQALDFTNRVGALAEAQNHHPDIYLAWGKVKLTLWTHKLDGLTESDFVFAAKVNPLAGA
jgi:4a-hydroxytetrahydrobiopterin dehydratase